MLIAVLIVVVAFLFGPAWLASRDGKLVHEVFLRADVIGVIPLNSGKRFGVIVDLRLTDGTPLRLTTREGRIAGTIVDTACVERQGATKSGAARYRLRPLQDCAPRSG